MMSISMIMTSKYSSQAFRSHAEKRFLELLENKPTLANVERIPVYASDEEPEDADVRAIEPPDVVLLDDEPCTPHGATKMAVDSSKLRRAASGVGTGSEDGKGNPRSASPTHREMSSPSAPTLKKMATSDTLPSVSSTTATTSGTAANAGGQKALASTARLPPSAPAPSQAPQPPPFGAFPLRGKTVPAPVIPLQIDVVAPARGGADGQPGAAVANTAGRAPASQPGGPTHGAANNAATAGESRTEGGGRKRSRTEKGAAFQGTLQRQSKN